MSTFKKIIAIPLLGVMIYGFWIQLQDALAETQEPMAIGLLIMIIVIGLVLLMRRVLLH